MVASFFTPSPKELILTLKWAGWSIKDLQNLGKFKDIQTWIKAIIEAIELERKEWEKANSGNHRNH